MKIILSILIIIHGLIHLLGFTKAFNLAEVNQLNQHISKPAGLLWLTAGLLFLTAAATILIKVDWWWIVALAAIVISQLLIVLNWQDAKFGTIANIILILAVTAGFGTWNFHRSFTRECRRNLERTGSTKAEMLTENDIQHLPAPVQRYLRYSGVLNREKVKNVRMTFEGQLRGKDKDWMDVEVTQVNFYEKPTRLFYLNAKMMGLNVPGYHAYRFGKATMQIKLFGLIPIIDANGEKLDKAETVTIFNDMCLMNPATLIDHNITWKETDSLSSEASFTCNGITIKAFLIFNEAGQLINFISDDRYALSGKLYESYRFSTPVHKYMNVNGINVCAKADAVWHYPEGEFVYGKFNLLSIDYNVKENHL